MTISFVGMLNNGSGNGTTGGTADLQSGSVGDLLVLCVSSKYAFANTPSGWTSPPNSQASGGQGANGSKSGTARIAVFTRVADGSEGSTVSFTVTSGNSCRGNVARYAKTLEDWDVACTGGSDNTAGTAWSVTGAANPGIRGGDWVVCASGANDNDELWSAEAVSATGITWGTSSERIETGSANGDQLKLVVSDHVASSGTASAAPVFTMTANGTAANHPAGATVFLRIRETGRLIADVGTVTITGIAPTVSLAPDVGTLTISGFGPEIVTRRAILIPSLANSGLFDNSRVTKRWFRNGQTPSAPIAKRLAENFNQAMAQRQRVVFGKANVLGLHADFDSATNTDTTTWRTAFHTGPMTRTIRARTLFLPLPTATSISGAPYAQWTLTTGLTGAGTSTVQTAMTVPGFSATSDFTADELFSIEQEWSVSPDADYRIELHQVNRARPISASVYEMPRELLLTDQDPYAIDSSSIYQGGPIVQGPIEQMMQAAQELWRLGQPLFHWSIDLPGDVRTRTTNTARNMIDQTVTAASSTSPGWPVSVSYSGTLESSQVPVVMWAYASCPSGTGALTWRDQANNVIGNIAPAGAAAWYSTTGVLQDASSAAETTKVDVFFAGDGTHTTTVYAVGMFVYSAQA